MYTTRPFARSSLTPDFKQKKPNSYQRQQETHHVSGAAMKTSSKGTDTPGPVYPQNRLPQKHLLHMNSSHIPALTNFSSQAPSSQSCIVSHPDYSAEFFLISSLPARSNLCFCRQQSNQSPKGHVSPTESRLTGFPSSLFLLITLASAKAAQSLRLRNKHTSGKTQSLSTQTR